MLLAAAAGYEGEAAVADDRAHHAPAAPLALRRHSGCALPALSPPCEPFPYTAAMTSLWECYQQSALHARSLLRMHSGPPLHALLLRQSAGAQGQCRVHIGISLLQAMRRAFDSG